MLKRERKIIDGKFGTSSEKWAPLTLLIASALRTRKHFVVRNDVPKVWTVDQIIYFTSERYIHVSSHTILDNNANVTTLKYET
jgi:hypothetical protein